MHPLALCVSVKMSIELAAGAPIRLRNPSGKAPCILLAEDSHAARILTAALLRRMGCDVAEAENGEEALDHVRERDFDVIIMDIEMPVMDGIAAARAIRKLGGRSAATPLVALSAFLADTAQSRGWLDLFDITHPKPASREGLRRVVETMLALSASPCKPVTNSAHPPSLTGHAGGLLIDRDCLAQLQSQFKPPDWRALMDQVLVEMLNAFEAITLAFAAADVQAISNESHKVKGLARSFAAPRLASKAEYLEQRARFSLPPQELSRGIEDLRSCLNRTVTALRFVSAA
jgi:two-component system sensor histidine kinase/response regulator